MDKTMEYYNKNADKFVLGTLNVDMMTIQKKFIGYIPERGKVLDLGCGSGRDTLFFKGLGYDVIAVDGSAEMCKQAEKNIGQPVINMTFDKLDFDSEFDGIWACASLLHVPAGEIKAVLERVEKALKTGGYFYFSVKYGEFEGEREGRYYTDYTETSINELFSAFPSLKKVDMWQTMMHVQKETIDGLIVYFIRKSKQSLYFGINKIMQKKSYAEFNQRDSFWFQLWEVDYLTLRFQKG